MRYSAFAIVIVLSAMGLYGGDYEGKKKCLSQASFVSKSYVDSVMKYVSPPDQSRFDYIIKISIITSNDKTILQTNGEKFAIYKCEFEENIYQILTKLEQTCGLTPDPNNLRNVSGFNWKRHDLAKETFIEMHASFLAQLRKYNDNVRNRFKKLVIGGDVYTPIHSQEYIFVYDNREEHFEITGIDYKRENEPLNPMIEWAKTIQFMANSQE
jgi:hypothetical protein